MFATIIAFILATTFNYFLGKKMTFKNYKQTKKDIIGVFVVSGKYKPNIISVNEEEFSENINFDITLDDKYDISKYPIKNEEGIIDFIDISWVLDKKNYGIVPDLVLFISDIKNNRKRNYHLIYDNDKLVKYIIK